MSDDQVSYQRLPDELIAEIFQNKTLSSQDLVNCSLVSSKFVSTVNRSLYENLLVEVRTAHIGVYEGDTELDPYVYTISSWKLLRTLLDHETLTKYVKELEFDITYVNERGREPSNLITTKHETLATFLRLAPNVENVLFNECWGCTIRNLKVMGQHTKVMGLSVIYMEQEEEEFCTGHLPHLKRLSIASLIRKERNQFSPVGWSSLERLQLYGGVKSVTGFPSFVASSSTLRSLSTSIQLGINLDYSQFPVLYELDLDNDRNFRPYVEDSRTDSRSKARKFWKSLSQSPSLRTLSFDCDEYKPHLEEALFQASSNGPAGPTEPIPTLRCIRFVGEVQVERASILLTGPLATTLQKVVVPSSPAQPNADLISQTKLETVAALCEAKGIELVLADQPRVWWTLLD